MRTKKKVDTRENQGLVVTEKTIIHGTDKDPRLLAKVGVASTFENEDNVDKVMIDLEQYKKKVFQMKETPKKERGDGKILKSKHEYILSDIENLREACQILQYQKDALVL